MRTWLVRDMYMDSFLVLEAYLKVRELIPLFIWWMMRWCNLWSLYSSRYVLNFFAVMCISPFVLFCSDNT